jgi:hypothetical protein
MFTTELSVVMRCDRCKNSRNSVSIPVVVGSGGGICCEIDDLPLPEGWSRIETRFYKRLHVCSECINTHDKIIYEGTNPKSETLSAVL